MDKRSSSVETTDGGSGIFNDDKERTRRVKYPARPVRLTLAGLNVPSSFDKKHIPHHVKDRYSAGLAKATLTTEEQQSNASFERHGLTVEWRPPTTARDLCKNFERVVGVYDEEYWTLKYINYNPPRIAWDLAFPTNTSMDEYFLTRQQHPEPKYLTWFNLEPPRRDGERRIKLSSLLEGRDGDQAESHPAPKTCRTKDQGMELISTTAKPKLGGLYPYLDDIDWKLLHYHYPDVYESFRRTGLPPEWSFYCNMEQTLLTSPELYSSRNDDVAGGVWTRGIPSPNRMDSDVGMMARESDDLSESKTRLRKLREYTYKMRYQKRITQPQIGSLLATTTHVKALDKSTPVEILRLFVDGFQSYALPFIQSVRMGMDVLTRPFSFKEECPSRLDGTLHVLVHMLPLLHDTAILPFLNIIDAGGKEIERRMDELLLLVDDAVGVLDKIYIRLTYAKSQMEVYQNTWRLFIARNFLVGVDRFNILRGFFVNSYNFDRDYGVPEYQSILSSRRELYKDHYSLELFPPPEEGGGTKRIPYTFYWFNDGEAHIHCPVTDTCVPFSSLPFEEKTATVKHLVANAVDMIEVAKTQLCQANVRLKRQLGDGTLRANLAARRTTGRTSLFPGLALAANDSISFETLLDCFWDVLYNIGLISTYLWETRAHALASTFQKVYDLHDQVHLIRPKLLELRRYLKENSSLGKLARGATSRRNLTLFMMRNPSATFKMGELLTTTLFPKRKKFVAVRFSMSDVDHGAYHQTLLLGQGENGSLDQVKGRLRQFYYVDDGFHKGYRNIKRHRWKLHARRMRAAFNLVPFRFNNFRISDLGSH